MLSSLPLLFLVLAAAAFLVRRRSSWPRLGVRDSLLIGALCTGLWAFIGAEGLSVFKWFSRIPVLAWWAIPVVLLGVMTWPRRSQLRIAVGPVPRPDRTTAFLLTLAALILLFTGLMALFTPTTTWDCLSYHLPRQVYWIQHRCVDAYPSADLRQMEMPPLAEYIGAQLMLLSGTDHQSNMVQWFSYLLSAIAASAIARDLGAGARAQAFAALLVLLNPAAATQAENAKNDIVVALWTMTLSWAAVRIWLKKRCDLFDAVIAGVSLGLMLLTKGTGYAFAFPLCVIIGIAGFRAGFRSAVIAGVVLITIAAVINTPFWVRNQRVFDNPIRLPLARGGFKLENLVHSPAAIMSNIVRNLALHTSGPWPEFNDWQTRQIDWFHHRIGIDMSDVRTTTNPVALPFVVEPNWFGDGNGPAPVHVVLGAAMVFTFRPRRLGGRIAWPIYLVPFVQMFLFAFLLKWQPWHQRLHIPIVSLSSALIAVWIQRLPPLMPLAALPAAAVAILGVLYNNSKSLVGPITIWGQTREEMMFRLDPQDRLPLHDLADMITRLGARTVALDIAFNTCEYVTMRTMLDYVVPTPRLVQLESNFGLIGPPHEAPDCAIVRRRNASMVIPDASSGTPMTWVSGVDRYRLYVPQNQRGRARQLLPVPEFFGWDAEFGLDPAEGPFPLNGLPVVRCINQYSMKLEFDADNAPLRFIAQVRRNETLTQELTIKLDDRDFHHMSFGTDAMFQDIDLPLDVSPGRHTLTFEVANINEPGLARGVLFRRLLIVGPDDLAALGR